MKTAIAIAVGIISSFSFGAGRDVLIGGVADLNHAYPEVVYIHNDVSSCSGTLIGDRVLLTAAHCTSQHGTMKSATWQRDFRSKCYHSTSNQDFALCLLDRSVDGPYASIASEGPKIGQMITLAGYGCIGRGGYGGNDGVLRVGKAPVVALTGSATSTFMTRGAVALCYGDSGGPAMIEKTGRRWVIGVNSQGNIRDTSYLEAVYLKKAWVFFNWFIDTMKVDICGINIDCEGI